MTSSKERSIPNPTRSGPSSGGRFADET
ncbi:hypothetical protein DBR06_SOUSAS910026 [Sousa chinensis]|nr:hypothetical protein DBR06_SOUSAS910026 [Sousa chinensis]